VICGGKDEAQLEASQLRHTYVLCVHVRFRSLHQILYHGNRAFARSLMERSSAINLRRKGGLRGGESHDALKAIHADVEAKKITSIQQKSGEGGGGSAPTAPRPRLTYIFRVHVCLGRLDQVLHHGHVDRLRGLMRSLMKRSHAKALSGDNNERRAGRDEGGGREVRG